MCHLEQFVQVCIAALWVCEEKVTTRKRTSILRSYEVERHITRGLLWVKEQEKQHCDEINGNRSSVTNHISSLNILGCQCISLLLTFSVSSNIIVKRVY
jgi:hypothetical protein